MTQYETNKNAEAFEQVNSGGSVLVLKQKNPQILRPLSSRSPTKAPESFVPPIGLPKVLKKAAVSGGTNLNASKSDHCLMTNSTNKSERNNLSPKATPMSEANGPQELSPPSKRLIVAKAAADVTSLISGLSATA